MDEILQRAIDERRLLMFAYGDRVRVVEPHLHGETLHGHRLLIAWLRPGYSRTSPDGGWRSFRTGEITALQMLTEHFDAPRAGFNPDDPRMSEVFARADGLPRSAAAASPPDAAHTPPADPPFGAVGA